MANQPPRSPGNNRKAGNPKARNRKVALMAFAAALGMLGLGYASVPLYRMFCQVTGFGGTTQRVDEAQAATVKDSGRTMSIRFDANVERGMPWEFKPLQHTDTVSIGVRDMALFWARNDSARTVTGTASFNVEPEQAARYFNKIQCFCFTEQTLKPGEEARMPVIYYIDPAILDDPDNKDVEQITLSYTFHVTSTGDAKALDQSGTGG
ncbi:cytochrome c oxidase assembly protein [Novosphingobium sp. CF614]|uniref:cytochrome c oxidase assembly protein n=1 Tax=Novosphingobium sp. CF614 TaxID=1884364 RepID=UPI002101C8A7|nr:cytochrome c oxidase assembly protein [Novosphingobium sp. CF614]